MEKCLIYYFMKEHERLQNYKFNYIFLKIKKIEMKNFFI